MILEINDSDIQEMLLNRINWKMKRDLTSEVRNAARSVSMQAVEEIMKELDLKELIREAVEQILAKYKIRDLISIKKALGVKEE